MPTVESPVLTLTTTEEVVTMRLTFDARFSPFERRLAGLGMEYRSHVDVIGIDRPGSTTATVVVDPSSGFSLFQHFTFLVTEGTVDQVVRFDRSVDVDRYVLEEDTGDVGELRCRVQIHAVGLPPALTDPVFTDQGLLGS